jgi:O-antigen ligase
VRQRTALLLILAAMVAMVALVGLASRLSTLLEAAGLTAALLVLLLSLRWPLLPLFVFAALIPMEEVLKLGDLGTLSKAAAILFAAVYAVPRLGRLTLRAMPLWAWAYVGWAILSIGWALDQDAALRELPTQVQLFVIAVLVADVVVQRPTVVRPLLWVYSLSAVGMALIAIATYVTGGIAIGDRIAAFENQDQGQFAALLLPALVFGVYQLLSGRLVLLSGAVVAVSATGILLSGTRGAWVSAVVVAVVLILPEHRSPRRIAAFCALVVLVVAALQLTGVGDFVARRIELAGATGGAGRLDIWSAGIATFESAPAIGVGFANFPIAVGWGPHSIIVGTLGELGLIGLILLALFVLPLVLRRGWGPDAAVIRAALASLLVAGLFLDVLSNRKQLWLLIGLAAGLLYLSRVRTASAVQLSVDLAGSVAETPPCTAVAAAYVSPGSA